MAFNDTVDVNGVSKTDIGTGYAYQFGVVVIITNTSANSYIKTYRGQSTSENIGFEQIADKLGATDIEGYVDAMAIRGDFISPPAPALDSILNAVIAADDKEYDFYSISDIDDLQCNNTDTLYVAAGFRLKDSPLATVHFLHSVCKIAQTNDRYKWKIHENPTLSGSPSFVSNPNGGDLEIYIPNASAVPAFTITDNGRVIYSGPSQPTTTNDVESPIRITAGNTYYLSVEPITIGLDFYACINTKQK